MRTALKIICLVGLGLFALVAAVWVVAYRPDLPYEKLEARYGGPESEYVDGPNGARFHYRDEGVSSGRTLVLVHGYSASTHTWDPWIVRLRNEHRLVALDLPGHGLTRTDGGPATRADLVAAVETVADHLHLDKFVLIGSSMGGETAWRFASLHPERVEALVLIGAAGWPRQSQEREPAVFKLLRSPAAPLVRDLETTPLVRQGLEAAFVDKRLVTDAMVRRYVDFSRAPGHRAAMTGLLLEPPMEAAATEAALKRITAPTLIMQGDKDALIPPAFAERFAAAMPGATLLMYKDIGHLPQEEIAERSATDLSVFLAQKLAPAPFSGAPLSAALP